MEKIYFKDSLIKKLPLKCKHWALPILFGDSCITRINNEAISCYMIINYAGIFFVKNSFLSTDFKIINFISIYLIKEIQYHSSKKRELLLNNKHNEYFICNHANHATQILFEIKTILHKSSLKLVTFPKKISVTETFKKFQYQNLIKYISYCYLYSEEPDNVLMHFFKDLDVTHNNKIFFDDTINIPIKCNIVSRTISCNNLIRTIHLKNSSPYIVCGFISSILNNMISIQTIVLEGYNKLYPSQLILDKIYKKRKNIVLNFIFINCNFNEGLFEELFEKISLFNVEFQRITFKSMNFNKRECTFLFDKLINSRCFRTIEMFELDDIYFSDDCEESFTSGITAFLVHFRFNQILSINNWCSKFSPSIIKDVFTSSLKELNLIGNDISELFKNYRDLHSQIRIFNFSKCSFSISTLKSLFKVLSRHPLPISLFLSDIKIKEDWITLFKEMKNFPSLNNLLELDWSGNEFISKYSEDFVNLFLCGKLKFLYIDRIFNPSTINDLNKLFTFIPKWTIWRLSIQGDSEHNFSGSLCMLLNVIQSLKSLTILNLNGQKLVQNDINDLLVFLLKCNSICGLSCDDTNLSIDEFLNLYREIMRVKISAIGRPYKDITRFIKGIDKITLFNNSKFNNFCKNIKKFHQFNDRDICGLYITQSNLPNDFESDDLYQFAKNYPPSFLENDECPPPISLEEQSKETFIQSLLSNTTTNEEESLSEIQNHYLKAPNPKIVNKIEMFDHDNEIDSIINKLNIEPLSRTKEMKEVINIIIESLNLYDYDEEEEEEEEES